MTTLSSSKSKKIYRGIKSKQSTSLDFIKLIGGEEAYRTAYDNETIHYVNEIISNIAIAAIKSITGVSREQLRSRSKFKIEAMSRHIYAYLMDKYSSMTLVNISNRINRDHSTVISSLDICKNPSLGRFDEELHSMRESAEKAFITLYKSSQEDTKETILQSIRDEISRLKRLNEKISSAGESIDVSKIVENLIYY